jgi:hypothetical protein
MKTQFVLTLALLLQSSTLLLAEPQQDAVAINASNPETVLSENEKKGEALWKQEYEHAKSGKTRSCTTCHGTDLAQPGKHIRTGKHIEPMAPSVNNKRFTDEKKLKKWFKRNCKWTMGRECTTEEQADILAWLKTN